MPGSRREPARTRALSEPAGLDRDLVCLDLETTGGNAAWHRIIEIGAVEVDRDGASREWSTLVNPGTRIPPSITAFTGITEQMVADAPAFEDVYRELLARLAGRVFVAHNARFDYSFIRAELARLDRRWTAPVLCTVKLSRRLYPGEPRHNLDAVIARHGLECTARHRALGDARVLRDLIAILRREIDPKRLADVVETLLHHAPLPPQLPPDLADELPESPGVYRFYGEDDTLLYVGKSRNLRGRVLEHFNAERHAGSQQRLAREVRRVTWTETAGELGALLAEAHAVKSLQPLHNRRLRSSPAAWTLRLEPQPGAPQRVVAVEVEALAPAQQAELYGLFRDRRAALRTLEEIVRAHQLCARVLGLERGAGVDSGAGSCFAYQLERCRGACIGREPAALHDTRLRLALASQRLKPWPYRGRVLVAERDWRGNEDLHVLAAWRHLGTVHEAEAAAELRAESVPFDPDVYRILRRFLRAPGATRIVELD
jgi:DNA polymerase-3 subunit epsilon